MTQPDDPRPNNAFSPASYATSFTPAPSHGGLAVASLVLGILGVVFSLTVCLSVVGLVLGVIGVVLGVVAWVEASKNPRRLKGMAVTGTVLSASAVLIAVLLYVGLLLVGMVAGQQAGPAFQQLQTQLEEAGSRAEVVGTTGFARIAAVEEARAAGVDAATVREAEQNFDRRFDELRLADAPLETLRADAEEVVQQLRSELGLEP